MPEPLTAIIALTHAIQVRIGAIPFKGKRQCPVLQLVASLPMIPKSIGNPSSATGNGADVTAEEGAPTVCPRLEPLYLLVSVRV